MKSNWKKIKSWNVGSADGSSETYSLYENKNTGDFRIQNDFGNITIDMERMSAREFLKKVSSEIDATIGDGMYDDDWFADLDLDDDSTDCDSGI